MYLVSTCSCTIPTLHIGIQITSNVEVIKIEKDDSQSESIRYSLHLSNRQVCLILCYGIVWYGMVYLLK